MPILLLFTGLLETAFAGVSFTGLFAAGQAALAVLFAGDAFIEWLDTNAGAALIAEQLNKRLAAAGVGLEFPPFNPLLESGREVFKKTIEAYALERLNTKAGTNIQSIADLTPENFTSELGRVLAAPINTATGSNFSSVYPLANLKDQLHTEVIRQFDNRGRYAAGSLFKSDTMNGIRSNIAAKHPELMQAAPPQVGGGMWGPAKDAAEATRREKGKVRQEKYRRTHQQVWVAKQ